MKRQPWFWPIKLFLKRISGKELWLRRDVSLATANSAGWDFIADRLGTDSIVYSLGVGDSVELDVDLIERYNLTVFGFDPTPFAMQWVEQQNLPARFIFNPWAAAASDGALRLYRRVNRSGKSAEVMWTADANAGDPDDYIDAPAYTIATMMDKLGHERIDLLKMDVEGAEFEILEGLRELAEPPQQLLVEFHHRFPGVGKQRTATSIAALRELGYRIFAISETGREVGFVLDPARS